VLATAGERSGGPQRRHSMSARGERWQSSGAESFPIVAFTGSSPTKRGEAAMRCAPSSLVVAKKDHSRWRRSWLRAPQGRRVSSGAKARWPKIKN